jgi:hypothetical protein
VRKRSHSSILPSHFSFVKIYGADLAPGKSADFSACYGKHRESEMLTTILIVVLILVLLGALPTWPQAVRACRWRASASPRWPSRRSRGPITDLPAAATDQSDRRGSGCGPSGGLDSF